MNHLAITIEQKQKGNQIITRRMLYSAGIGLIPIPIVDAAGIITNQLLMIHDIAKVYQIPFEKQKAKVLIGTLVGNLGTVGVVKAIPGVGSVLGGVAVSISGAAATYAIGKVFLQHFNQGGTLLDFDPEKSRKYFQDLYEEGKVEVNFIQHSKGISSEEKPLAVEQKALSKSKQKKNGSTQKKKSWRNFILLLLLGVIVLFFFLGTYFQSGKSTESTTYFAETISVQANLNAIENIDSTMSKSIHSFSSFSTESEIFKYLQNSESTYPKRYILSAVRFNNENNLISEGGREQIENIALLMKIYPALEIHFYGQTRINGPTFYRRKLGRDRARVLVELIEAEPAIDNFRVTGNFIEKPFGIYNEYWGAEVVIDIATIESEVEIYK